MSIRTTMDFPHSRYYRLNEILMKLTGQWPYQSTRVRLVMLISLLLISSTQLIPLSIAIMKNLHDWDFLMECGVSVLFSGFVLTKYAFSFLTKRKMLMLLSRIRADWKLSAQDCDFDVLHEYAEMGRKMTIGYGVMSYTGGILCGIQPIIPKIIDVLFKNGTKPGQFPVPADYCNIDMQKYYFYIVTNASVCVSIGFVISLTYDCMFMTYVQHACGLFAVLGRKLERIGHNEASADQTAYALRQSDMDSKQLITCIAMHKRAIEFAELIEETYSWCFLCVLGMNMLLISLSGVQIFTESSDPQESMRYVAGNLVAVVHVYIDSYMSQRLMDHSADIQHRIIKGKWYALRLKNQKLLLFMMMRSKAPCQITAGKMAVMSVENFAVILKTSMSYFTLLRST